MPDRRTVDSLLASLPPKLRGTVVGAAELRRRKAVELERPPLPTGIGIIDRPLGGGLPRGALVEVTGRGSSGRLSTVLAALASATARGEAAALVDRGGALDPGSAARLGVSLDRLLWVLPDRLTDAVRSAEELLSAGFPLVVLEAGIPPLPGRPAAGAWLRLARLARAHGAVALVSSPYRLTGPAAGTVLHLQGRRGILRTKRRPILAGLESSLAGGRHRGVALLAAGSYRWLLPDAALTDPGALSRPVPSGASQRHHGPFAAMERDTAFPPVTGPVETPRPGAAAEPVEVLHAAG